MRVLIVGAGAIGGPAALALAADTSAQIRVCDDDVVEISNLQRQIQFTTDDVGQHKVQRLAEARSSIEPRVTRFSKETASALLDGVDLVIDGSDNFATKFAVNDEARARAIPAIIASAIGARGQLFVAAVGRACYRCLFEAPPAREPGSCAQVGVLAPMPGLVAGHAARAGSELLAGTFTGPSLTVFPSATEPTRAITFDPRPDCSACSQTGARIAS